MIASATISNPKQRQQRHGLDVASGRRRRAARTHTHGPPKNGKMWFARARNERARISSPRSEREFSCTRLSEPPTETQRAPASHGDSDQVQAVLKKRLETDQTGLETDQTGQPSKSNYKPYILSSVGLRGCPWPQRLSKVFAVSLPDSTRYGIWSPP